MKKRQVSKVLMLIGLSIGMNLLVNASTTGHLGLNQETDTMMVSFNTTANFEIANAYMKKLTLTKVFSSKLKNKELFIHNGIIYILGNRDSSTITELEEAVKKTNELLSDAESLLLNNVIKSKQKKADKFQKGHRILKKVAFVTIPVGIAAGAVYALFHRKK